MTQTLEPHPPGAEAWGRGHAKSPTERTRTMTTNEHEELVNLKANLKAGTCCGKRASKAQQDVRRRRIAELEAN